MVLLLVALALAAPALAQAATTTATTPSAVGITPTTTTATTATSTTPAQPASSSSSHDKRWIAVAVLLFGVIVVWMLLQYLKWEQGAYFALRRWMAQRFGRQSKTAYPSPIVRTLLQTGAGTAALKIETPDRMEVGDEQPLTAEKGDAKVSAKWAATPDGLTLTPVEGDTVTAKAVKAGTYEVTASVDPDSVKATITVQESDEDGIPFIGVGYGTLILAIVLLVAATVLGLLDAFNGALATLFGAVAGYIFVKAGSDGGGGSSGGASSSGTAK